MVQVIINLPESVAGAFGDTPEARSRRVTEDAAIEEYRVGKLSQRQVGRMLDLGYWETEEFLRKRGVPLNYGVDDLEADGEALGLILAPK